MYCFEYMINLKLSSARKLLMKLNFIQKIEKIEI